MGCDPGKLNYRVESFLFWWWIQWALWIAWMAP